MPKARCAALLHTRALVPTVEDACSDEVAAGVNLAVHAPDFLRRHLREDAGDQLRGTRRLTPAPQQSSHKDMETRIPSAPSGEDGFNFRPPPSSRLSTSGWKNKFVPRLAKPQETSLPHPPGRLISNTIRQSLVDVSTQTFEWRRQRHSEFGIGPDSANRSGPSSLGSNSTLDRSLFGALWWKSSTKLQA
jgi:hypothetical protein